MHAATSSLFGAGDPHAASVRRPAAREARVRAAFARERLACDMAWYREDVTRFGRLKETLFLTQKELRERANTPLFGDLNGEAS